MIVVLMVVAVGVVLAVPATAGADVSKAHAKAYEAKLRVYGKLMEVEQGIFNSYSQTATNYVGIIQISLGHPDLLANAEQMCLDTRGEWQHEVRDRSKDSGKDIARFAAQALTWFPPKTAKADKKSFAAALKLLRGGFTELYAAERELGSALLSLGIGADIPTANDKIFAAGGQAITASATFDDGLKGLRKLQ
ncbi:MAG: hypothetical protein NTX16_03075 [Actinobacteria bacterium]|nr:hypothetical protein [Actinomycetota bacterium]